MGTIMPQGELLRRAVTWIDAQRHETGKAPAELIDTAAMRFNLGPKDVAFLTEFFKKQQEAGQG